MKHKFVLTFGATSLVALLAIAGCASGSAPDSNAGAGASHEATTHAATLAPTPEPEEPVSEIDAAVQTFVGALDDLNFEHTDPVRAEVGGSGATARFDINVNGFDAGINVFPTTEALAVWGELSDSFGGIYVAHGNAVLTLNSTEGIANSAEIAPQIAAAIGGEAHGV